MDKMEVKIDGIPYIHYLPQKTLKNNEHKEEMEIPIMKYALENVKKMEVQVSNTKVCYRKEWI